MSSPFRKVVLGGMHSPLQSVSRRVALASRPSAFTLVELLVVIAIIGVLVALLLPAVQAAREAARRVQCVNNQKQIGVAVALHELAHKELPSGALYYEIKDRGLNDQWVRPINLGNILMRILPYVEQQAIYDAINWDTPIPPDGPGLGFPKLPDGTDIGSIQLPIYTCPSDIHPDNPNGRKMHNYSASAGSSRIGNNTSCSCALSANFNQFALSEVGNYVPPTGVFSRYDYFTRLREISDGLSNTIFFGEVRPACSNHIASGWTYVNNGNGLATTVIPINYDTCSQDESEPDGCKRPCNYGVELGFKSSHPGGAHFIMGDGSVHFFSENIDMLSYQYLGARADGNIIPQLPF